MEILLTTIKVVILNDSMKSMEALLTTMKVGSENWCC